MTGEGATCAASALFPKWTVASAVAVDWAALLIGHLTHQP
jgi:hypothetical protein